MKFTCTQENIFKALDLVTPLTGKNLSLPILNNILISVTNTDISFSSTNLELAVSTNVRGKIENKGTATINGRLIRDFISLQPTGKIECTTKEHKLNINSSSSKTTIKTTPADEFPVIPQINPSAPEVEISIKDFSRAVRAILPAITLNESRPEISGLFMSFEDSKIILTGTDSYRLAEYLLPVPAGTAVKGAHIIPLRTIQEVLRIFGESNSAKFVFTENQFGCKNEQTQLVSRLIEGNYPDYKQIIPSEEKTTISLNRIECIQAVKTASLFCKTGVNDIELSTKKEDKLMIIAAANNQVGENITTLPALVTGDDTSIVFNYRYVLDALATMETEEVLLALNGPESTGVFRQTDNTPLIHLVMPIRQ